MCIKNVWTFQIDHCVGLDSHIGVDMCILKMFELFKEIILLNQHIGFKTIT
jgi:hypothetical protein